MAPWREGTWDPRSRQGLWAASLVLLRTLFGFHYEPRVAGWEDEKRERTPVLGTVIFDLSEFCLSLTFKENGRELKQPFASDFLILQYKFSVRARLAQNGFPPVPR